MHLGAEQCDWVTFLIECEPDLFQTHYLEEWKMLVVAPMTTWAQKHQQRVHALGTGDGGRRRYTLSLWGESAPLHARLPFGKWSENLTRYDVKRRLYDIRPDTYERLCVALQFAETRRNVEAFKLPKRTKNAQRDSGGEGVRFGSRKSDLCTKLSKRGREVPYFETQIQDDKLGAVVLEQYQTAEGRPYSAIDWEHLLFECARVQDKHIETWLRLAGIDKDIDHLRHEDIPMPKKLKDLFHQEMLWGGDYPEPPPDEPDDIPFT
jgi:hypothetical protein